jgi:hypothetical protein
VKDEKQILPKDDEQIHLEDQQGRWFYCCYCYCHRDGDCHDDDDVLEFLTRAGVE